MSKRDAELDTEAVIKDLNAILEMELAGVCRYLHYSMMIFGYGRIPIIKWMRDQATEGMDHAAMAGEHVTTLGGHPSLKIGKLTESHKHDTEQILREALEHEHATLDQYYSLLEHVAGRSVWLEEYARDQIRLEEGHIAEVEKMLRRPGDLSPAR
jgi:bacterioferritin